MSALDTQVGGDHYKDLPIQPVEFCQRNQLNACESAIIKYACRHKSKGGRQDLEKIKHYVDLLIQMEYDTVRCSHVIGELAKSFVVNNHIGDTEELVHDGWIPHVGTEMPAALSSDDYVMVKLVDGDREYPNETRRVKDWSWNTRGCAAITHYKVVNGNG